MSEKNSTEFFVDCPFVVAVDNREQIPYRFEGIKSEKIGALDANYLKAIDREINKAADAGDISSVAALREEKKRIERRRRCRGFR